MNIFGSFTFGSLIKTFLPGFVWLIALGLLFTDFAQWKNLDTAWWSPLWAAQTLLAFAILPASILFGLLSNVIVFMGVNDRLVRDPVRKKCKELFELHDALAQNLREQCWKKIHLTEAEKGSQTFRKSFDTFTDPEIIIVERVGVPELAYVREQYWYHLEFQLNLFLSTIALAISLTASVFLNARSEWSFWLAIMILTYAGLVCWGLVGAARKNYARHISKMASLLVALLSRESDPPQSSGYA